MKILMVNASSNIEKRVDILYDFLRVQGHEVTVFASDYLHAEKTKRSSTERGYRLIETLPYRRNISLQRLYSHWRFSRDVLREIREMSADLLYLVVPQNSNAAIAGAYRKAHPEAKIIIDIVDMWPESLPVGGTDRFPFSLWAAVRDRHLHDADLVLLECDYYRERLGRRLEGVKNMTLPWLRRHTEWTSRYRDEENVGAAKTAIPVRRTLRLCYLGAVNNIIDLDAVEKLLMCLRDAGCAVTLELVAVGERKAEFIRRSQTAGAEVMDHGPIYDAVRLQEIMDSCDYGLNLMKSTVCVGLSMKLVDYLAAGLPVINNLPGDSRELMETVHCGLQWPADAETLCTARFDRREIRRVYEERFSSVQLARYWQEVEKRL